MTRRRLSYLNLWTRCSRTWTSRMSQLTCKRKLKIRQKKEFVVSWKYSATRQISIQIFAAKLYTATKKLCSTFCTGCWPDCLIFKEKLTLLASWCHYKCPMSLWLTKKWGRLCKSLKTCRLSFRPFTKELRAYELSRWIQPTWKRRSLN